MNQNVPDVPDLFEYAVPTSGKGLFKWIKDVEQKYQIGLLKWANGEAKLEEFPSLMTEWNEEQFRFIHSRCIAKMSEVEEWEGPRIEPFPSDDLEPCRIADADPFRGLKTRIKNAAWRLTVAGKKELAAKRKEPYAEPTQAEVMEVIDGWCYQTCGGEQIGSLRACANVQLLTALAEALKAEADKLAG